MGRRFEREQENMTAMPEQEEAIFAKLDCAPLPADKTVLDLPCAELSVGGRDALPGYPPDRPRKRKAVHLRT